MSKELVISASSHERRVAILEEGQLVEIYIEREKEFALVGSIYKGKVTRVLPGMQSAFVDIGLDGDAFLYVSDVFENLEDYDHGHGAHEAPAPVIVNGHANAPREVLPGESLSVAGAVHEEIVHLDEPAHEEPPQARTRKRKALNCLAKSAMAVAAALVKKVRSREASPVRQPNPKSVNPTPTLPLPRISHQTTIQPATILRVAMIAAPAGIAETVVEIVEETVVAVDVAADLAGVVVAVIGRRWVRIAVAAATCLHRNTLHRRVIVIRAATRIVARMIEA